MIDYTAIKEAADMERVAASCGIEIDSRHKAICPFHDDRHPSMQIYPDGFHCFVCGAHGDAIDFIERLKGCTKYEAAKIVAEISGGAVAGVGVSGSNKQEERKQRKLEYQNAWNILCDADRQVEHLRRIMEKLPPYSPAWCWASKAIDVELARREAADQTLLRMRFERYEKKHGK